MTLRIDFYGFTYDAAVPAFVEASPRFVLHRGPMRLLERTALDAAMAAAAYTPATGEIKRADEWLKAHAGLTYDPDQHAPGAGSGGGGGGGTNTAATVAVAGAGTASVTFTVGGAAGGAKAGKITVSPIVIGSDTLTVPEVVIAAGDTPEQIATKLAAAMEGLKNAGNTTTLKAVAAGKVVTLTEAGGAVIPAGVTATVS